MIWDGILENLVIKTIIYVIDLSYRVDKPQTPIYGHTMVSYKDKLIIYGGICSTEINETTIIKTNKMTI